ncbi:hypothetical protein [Virgibacillus salexigens]|uniref:Phage portal protein n=1 Tax=Virgibacillus kapii TaxID=1638645 RepID=A0ABQ2DKS8_9BACI|nr:hypothetical protein [Virgibacillus kapii]GGJ61788.1 hypothetical protein GCM10007111_24890 [Virgibacillus kapii]
MIREALQYLISQGQANILKENGQAFSDKPLHLVENPTSKAMNVHTLSGLVGYLKSEFDGKDPVIVHVLSPTEVIVTSPLNGDAKRDYYIKAEALLPTFHFDRFYDTDKFNIKLQSVFVKNEDRDLMLKVVGNITEDQVKTVKDDGVSQAVVAKVGVASVGNVEVPNPVLLAPYRTFLEVIQPESEFVFRMQSGPECALFEADGGAWKNEAIDNIKGYLEASLKDEIESNRITIIA